MNINLVLLRCDLYYITITGFGVENKPSGEIYVVANKTYLGKKIKYEYNTNIKDKFLYIISSGAF
jgi:hypothetical protein